jgi:hypothetical protein
MNGLIDALTSALWAILAPARLMLLGLCTGSALRHTKRERFGQHDATGKPHWSSPTGVLSKLRQIPLAPRGEEALRAFRPAQSEPVKADETLGGFN